MVNNRSPDRVLGMKIMSFSPFQDKRVQSQSKLTFTSLGAHLAELHPTFGCHWSHSWREWCLHQTQSWSAVDREHVDSDADQRNSRLWSTVDKREWPKRVTDWSKAISCTSYGDEGLSQEPWKQILPPPPDTWQHSYLPSYWLHAVKISWRRRMERLRCRDGTEFPPSAGIPVDRRPVLRKWSYCCDKEKGMAVRLMTEIN